MKFRPIIAQTGTYTYNAAQVIASYLKPLTEENPNIIRNTQDFPTLLKEQPPLDIDEEFDSYNVEYHYSLISQLKKQLTTSSIKFTSITN